MRRTAFFMAMAAMFAAPAGAQDVARYRLERTDEGYVRLDTVTGRAALCREQGDQLVCRMAADERAAYDSQLEELEARVAGLEERLAALESKWPELRLPNSDDFEQTMNSVEQFLRRFMGIAKDLEREFGEEEPGADRT